MPHFVCGRQGSHVSKGKLMNLYQLDTEFSLLQDKLESLDGENLTPELENEITQLLSQYESLSEQWQSKIDNYCKLISWLEGQAKIRKAEADRLTKLSQSDFKKVEILKDKLKDSLKTRGLNKVRTNLYNLSVSSNGGRVPLVLPDNIDVLPPDKVVIRREPDKEAIRLALESGEVIDGCFLQERGDHLRIK
jgi:hypothetical protein